jgi:hypothetical protein
MLILTGTLLVLLTWACLTAAVIGLGLLVASVVSPKVAGITLIRHALWWGLFIATLLVGVCSLIAPLRSPAVGGILAAAVVVLGVVGLVVLRRRRAGTQLSGVRASKAFWCIFIVLAAAQTFLAVAALGPVTGYDTGLYHLGAVQYSADYSAIPGLANLYGPLGYASMEFPLAGVLENGPWGSQGYRLLNGLLMGLVAVDLVLRVARRRWTVGTYVLIVGVAAAWVPMIALSDFWVTSPSQDSSVLSLTLVAVAYLADFIGKKGIHAGDASVAVLCALLTWLIRPTMAVFALSLAAVALFVLLARVRRNKTQFPVRLITVTALAIVMALIVSGARDYRLSGWLQYPLSIHAFDVPWLAPDPENLRLATLGFHRDPSNMWDASTGWAWVGPWFSRLPRQWETFELLAMFVAAVSLLLVAIRGLENRSRIRGMLLMAVPSAVAVAAWWLLSPPSFRFSWGPLFTLLAIPIGWSLWTLSRNSNRANVWRMAIVAGLVLPIALVVAYSSLFRLHLDSRTGEAKWSLGVEVPYSVTPIVEVNVRDQTAGDGLIIRMPVSGKQCWGEYPLCSPQFSGYLHFLGKDIQGGFSSSPRS